MTNWKDCLNYLKSFQKIILSLIIVLLLLASNTYAQAEQDTIQNVQNKDSVFVMTKSPWGAVLRSAVVPGWGQFYNESYWKIPVVWGFLGYYSYVWVDQNNKYKDYRDQYLYLLKHNPDEEYKISRIKEIRDFYRDQRDEFAIYFGLAYFLNLLDAYVDAHMFDFNVKVDPYTQSPQLQIQYNFN